MPPTPLRAPRRGRPPKFGRPAQPVTLTLPDDVVDALRALDADLSRAIVRLAGPSAARLAAHPPAELSYHGRRAVITVTPTRSLERLPGVELVPLPDGRALISLDGAIGIAEFEVMIRDALDGGNVPAPERAVFEALGLILRNARRARDTSLRACNIIVLESRRSRTTGSTGRPASRGGQPS